MSMTLASSSTPNCAVPDKLFPHQHAPYLELHAVATAFFGEDWQDFPVRPRSNILLTGPTGLGKTEVARTVASKLELPFLEIVFTDWLPMGTSGRGSTHTWPLILRFIERYAVGMIFVDELDKAGDDNWNRYITLELFNLLDHKIAANILDEDVDDNDDLNKRRKELAAAQKRLRERFLIVGAGAFQSLCEGRSHHLGFGAAEPERPLELNELARVLPRELTNRFRGKIIHMQPLKREDYVAILHRSARQMPAHLQSSYLALGAAGLDAAVRNQQGVRFFEEIAMDAVITMRGRGTRIAVPDRDLDCAA